MSLKVKYWRKQQNSNTDNIFVVSENSEISNDGYKCKKCWAPDFDCKAINMFWLCEECDIKKQNADKIFKQKMLDTIPF